MPVSDFDAFQRELSSLNIALQTIPGKLVRDPLLRARIQELFRSWTAERRALGEQSSPLTP